jgi:hypothetical protein
VLPRRHFDYERSGTQSDCQAVEALRKDRLYVTGVDARPIGWWDLLALEGHPESADLAAALDGAVSTWLAMAGKTTSVEMAQGVADPVAPAQVFDVVSLSSAEPEPDVELIPGPTPGPQSSTR